MIPLKEHFALLFLKGAVTEMQITHEDVLGTREMRGCKYLFISGLAVRNPENQEGNVSASILVWAIMRYLQHFYSATEPMVFALASSPAGDALLQSSSLKSDARLRVALTDTNYTSCSLRGLLCQIVLNAFQTGLCRAL